MIVTKITGSVSKRISVEERKGLWRAWEVGFGAEADLEEGENWEEMAKRLNTELKKLATSALPRTTDIGGGKNETSAQTPNRSDSFNANATLAAQYE